MPHRYAIVPRWLLPLALGLAATLPLLLRGPSCGHDFDFHLQGWLAVHAAWQGGLLAPHWVAGANYGAGEPRFVFYPPLSWLLGAVLGTVLPWNDVPAAFTALCLAGAAATMRQLAGRFCPPVPAALAAVLYALSPYLLFTAYERTAYGELLAAVWMPPLLAALLAPRLPFVRVALLVAALWYTNAPAAVMGCYMVLLATLWNAAAGSLRFENASVKRVVESAARKSLGWLLRIQPPAATHATPLAIGIECLRGVGALSLGCVLAADYLLPAWYEQRFVAIERAVGPGMRVEDSFLFGHTGEMFHDRVLHTASLIAVATLAAGLASAVAFALLWRQEHAATLGQATELIPAPPHLASASNSSANTASHFAPYPAPDPPPEQETLHILPLVFLLSLCGVMQLRGSAPLWHVLPKLGFLQFPWRLLLPASAAMALLVSCAWSPRRSRWRFTFMVTTALLYAGSLITWAAQSRYQPCDDEDRVSAQLRLFASGAGFEGTDEYAAAGSDNGEIQRSLPPVRLLRSPDADEGDDSGLNSDPASGSSLNSSPASTPGSGASDNPANPQWKPEPGSSVSGIVQVAQWGPEKLALRLRPQTLAYAVLRMERFPAWQVLLNGHPCGAACVPREDGLLTVRIPGGQWSAIEARYRATDDVLAGRALSCLALLLMLFVLLASGRRTRLAQGISRRRSTAQL